MYESEDEEDMGLPKKQASGPEKLDSVNREKSDYPAWEDLNDEQKLAYKSPMNYARKMLEAKIKKAQGSEMI